MKQNTYMANNKKRDYNSAVDMFTFGKLDGINLESTEVIANNTNIVKWGPKNDFINNIIKMYISASPIHTRLIKQKTQMISAKGWVNDFENDFKKKLFFDNRFSKNNWNAIIEDIAQDTSLIDMWYVMVEFDATKNVIARCEYIPVERVRTVKCSPESDQEVGHEISRDWTKASKPENKPVFFYDYYYNESLPIEQRNTKVIFKAKIKTKGMDYYTEPSYSSAMDAIRGLYSLNRWHLKSIKQGFSAGHIITLEGEFTSQEKDFIESSFETKYNGEEEAGNNIFIYLKPGQVAPEIKPNELPDTDNRWLDLKKTWIEDIIEAHGANFAVAGRAIEGQLGANTSLEPQFEFFQKSIIDDYQKFIEDNVNILTKKNGIESPFVLTQYDYFDETQAIDVATAEKTPTELNIEAQAVLRGSVGGVQSLLSVQQAVAAGTTSRSSALATIRLIFGFSESEAQELLGDVQESPTQITQ